MTQDVVVESPAPEAEAVAAPAPADSRFETGTVLVIASGHLIHDIFASFVAPLLPAIIAKLGLSLALAGTLAAFQQAPSLINPVLGAAADRVNLRWLVVLAPTVTACAMSVLGLAPSYEVLALLLLVTGLSIAALHVPAPAMIARISGRRVGQGMSLFMVGGELAYTLGPLLIVAAVSWWGLEGTWRLIPLGVFASGLLYWRTRGLTTARAVSRETSASAGSWGGLLRVMWPLTGMIVAQGFMLVSLNTFLPTLLAREGRSLAEAGAAYSLIQLAGAAGVTVTGPLSDRIGRRRVLAFAMLTAPPAMGLFLLAGGWLVYPALFLLGFLAYSTNPVLMAIVQEHGRARPATANGLYMALQFAGRSLIIIAVGAVADRIGLRATYAWSAVVALLAVPFVLALPGRDNRTRNEERLL